MKKVSKTDQMKRKKAIKKQLEHYRLGYIIGEHTLCVSCNLYPDVKKDYPDSTRAWRDGFKDGFNDFLEGLRLE